MFVLFITVINPRLGITSPLDLSNPDVLLPALQRTPAILIFPGLDIVVGFSLFVVVISLQAVLEQTPLMRYATPTGIGAAFLFIVLSTNRLATLPELAVLYSENAAVGREHFFMVNALHLGLTDAIHLLLGAWLLGVSLTVRRLYHMRWLVMVGLLLAVVNFVGVLIEPVAGLNVVLTPVYFFSLARWLLVEQRLLQVPQ